MRRTVNSLLQFIEDDRSESLIVGATNHGQMIDRAMFRRFDEVVAFAIPSKDEVTTLVRRKLDEDADQIDVAAIYAAIVDPMLGHTDVCAALDRVRKDHVLVGAAINTNAVVDAVAKRARGAEVLA